MGSPNLDLSRPLYSDPVGEWWWNSMQRPRAALCVLAGIAPSNAEVYRWTDLPADHRVRLVRAMRELGEVSVQCAIALELAHSSLRSSDAHN